MKNLLILILTIILLSSCSKSIYYAYEQDGTYCTFELTKDKYAIYRAVSPRYYKTWTDYSTKNYEGRPVYIYMESFDESYDGYVSIRNFYDMYTLRRNNSFDICPSFGSAFESFISYANETKDSINLISYIDKPPVSDNLCIKENNIYWFPPYMKRVDKIDYKKFNLPNVKVKYLKNPEKASKNQTKF